MSEKMSTNQLMSENESGETPTNLIENKPETKDKPNSLVEELLKKDLNEFNTNSEALNQLFKLLNGLRFQKVESFADGGKFKVEIIDTGNQDFKYGLIEDNKIQVLPTLV